MIRFRHRLEVHGADAGMTIVEVVVALVVFALMATGVAAGSMSITRITADSRSREVATNLAAQELEQARGIVDVTQITSTGTGTDNPAKTQVVSGRTYTITRTAEWVGTSDADIKCGSNENVRYRRVGVEVRWTGQLSTTADVRSATLIAPRIRYSDAATGAISIRVTGVDGLPRSGVAVVVTPVAGTGSKSLTKQPDPTDVDGCSYATQITPGTYKIVLSKSGYIDTTQSTTPTNAAATVTAGSTFGWTVQYDRWATFSTEYAKNYSGAVQLPANLDTTFVPVSGSFKLFTTTAKQATVNLHPFPSGYEAVAGTFATPDRGSRCASMDPAAWPAGSVSGRAMAQGVRAKATAAPAGTSGFATVQTQSIPMGVVQVSSLVPSTITATSVAGPSSSGDPGCAAGATYTFTGLTPVLGSVVIALPFGSWSLTSAPAGGPVALPVGRSNVTVLTNNHSDGVSGGNGSSGAVVTLDPRIPR